MDFDFKNLKNEGNLVMTAYIASLEWAMKENMIKREELAHMINKLRKREELTEPERVTAVNIFDEWRTRV